MEDLDNCGEYINSLVKEGVDILRDTRVSSEEEAEWLGKRLSRIVKGQIIYGVAEVDGSEHTSTSFNSGYSSLKS